MNEFVDITKYGIEKIAEDEIFKEVPNFSHFLISNYGRVYSIQAKIFRNLKKTDYNREILVFRALDKSRKSKTLQIHNLVAELFVPNPKNLKDIFFKNNNPRDLKASNLEWGNLCNYLNEHKKISQDEVFINFKECDKFIISNFGRVYSKYLNQFLSKGNHYILGYKRKTKWQINRVIAECFVPNDNPFLKVEVSNIDRDLTNNHYKNLQWVRRGDTRIREDLTGRKFGKLTILGLDHEHIEKTKRIKWLCQCDCDPDGKNIKSITRNSLVSSNTKSCGCAIFEYAEQHRGNKNSKWSGFGEISGKHWNQIVKSATVQRDIEFKIDIKYAWNLFLEQNSKCKLSGLDLKFQSFSEDKDFNASLDRTDSSKGYIEGNVQWVHKDLNIMKQSYPNDYFIKMCELVGDYNKNKDN